jgi:hypothetical protein
VIEAFKFHYIQLVKKWFATTGAAFSIGDNHILYAERMQALS